MNILLIAGGWSGEREVALSGARQIEKGLLALGHHVTLFDPVRDLRDLYEAASGHEFAFINLHGSPGEDGLIQCLLERIGMPYQGSDSRASLLALNKAVSKQIFEAAGLSTPAWEFVPASHVTEWRPLLPFPLVVKPNTGGSSLGVGIVGTEEELECYLAQPEIAGQDLLAEALIKGQELTCGVLEGCVLPPILIRPRSGEFFDYESKYVAGATEEICPAPISAELTEKLQSMARAAHDALGLADYSRSDFMVATDGTPYLLEVNTLPGMTATSLLPQEALAVGLSFEQLLTRLIELGLRKKL
ncbi:D-alanine-D-alanine ligase [Desulfomicrobium norvegicum]|uniref:D-alanine--D-alanine ligase n=1 Tax=Desulfomicrobium norvegicum (strain DSM 1741 / NCIMB 8310) TaxID=52561 RepID=A0A8G2F943_DESNO|nr:D-alanine--D-alanine ligase [Desulfomicrobium norvegicum]SFM08390.1 D-alanine-D-alanine ligase [Desulfomicrobium norvegicum]